MRLFLRYWLPTLFWMGVISLLSTDFGSWQHTGGILAGFLLWLDPGISSGVVDRVNFLVRKGAHVTEYAILAALLWRACFGTWGGAAVRMTARVMLGVLLFCASYAALDEFHQTFVPSRTASVHDVLIDSTGSFLGVAVAWVCGVRRRKIQGGAEAATSA